MLIAVAVSTTANANKKNINYILKQFDLMNQEWFFISSDNRVATELKKKCKQKKQMFTK